MEFKYVGIQFIVYCKQPYYFHSLHSYHIGHGYIQCCGYMKFWYGSGAADPYL
jgi:hypothetical protein